MMMRERKFTRDELDIIKILCEVQFGEGELIATKVAGQKLHNLIFEAKSGRNYPIKAEDMMEMFPTDPFWYRPELWGIVIASLIAGGYYLWRG